MSQPYIYPQEIMSQYDDDHAHESINLPLREIPGNYGLPIFGALRDRWDYFYVQGEQEFFRSRVEKYQSTVFRTNMPPGGFIASNPKVVAVLDGVSFPVLFDNTKVEKTNVFTGTFMPSTAFTGGYRICSYLDPAEKNHTLLKTFISSTLASRHHKFIPLFSSVLSELLFDKIEAERPHLSEKVQINFNDLNDVMSFEYVFRLFCDGKSPSVTKLGSKGPSIIAIWLGLQLAPLISGISKWIPNFLDDLILHTFKFPYFPVKSNYEKLYEAFYHNAASVLDEAEDRMGIKRDEACHNLVFVACFNTYGGMKGLFPQLMKWVGAAGEELHSQLAREVRAVVKTEGEISFKSLEKMELTKSVVYEVLRIEPPVAYQYGKAKHDIVVQTHDAEFEIKKGEMIFGYQPFATNDAKIFDNPEEFVGDRFVGEGKRLLKYVYWSNGRETEEPTIGNKQCPGKELVELMCRVMLAEFFLRYDTFTVESKTGLSASVTLTSLTKASYK